MNRWVIFEKFTKVSIISTLSPDKNPPISFKILIIVQSPPEDFRKLI